MQKYKSKVIWKNCVKYFLKQTYFMSSWQSVFFQKYEENMATQSPTWQSEQITMEEEDDDNNDVGDQ